MGYEDLLTHARDQISTHCSHEEKEEGEEEEEEEEDNSDGSAVTCIVSIGKAAGYLLQLREDL